jgi:hypothetical protein
MGRGRRRGEQGGEGERGAEGGEGKKGGEIRQQ